MKMQCPKCAAWNQLPSLLRSTVCSCGTQLVTYDESRRVALSAGTVVLERGESLLGGSLHKSDGSKESNSR